MTSATDLWTCRFPRLWTKGTRASDAEDLKTICAIVKTQTSWDHPGNGYINPHDTLLT